MNHDMSPKAISARLKRVSELRRVCLALGRAKTAKPVSVRRAGSVHDGAQPYRSKKALPEDEVSRKKR